MKITMKLNPHPPKKEKKEKRKKEDHCQLICLQFEMTYSLLHIQSKHTRRSINTYTTL